mmetsp:Transcript_985/g.2654  ORF Transcript_985/g.2654 Transcript_985/m.2654 type:complete len:179 (+) Transcript_985:449-985(+)
MSSSWTRVCLSSATWVRREPQPPCPRARGGCAAVRSSFDCTCTHALPVRCAHAGLGRYFSSKTNMVHSTVGTPFYMSPECIQGTFYDWKSDIWSLGCLLYELATLRSPFYSDGLNYYTLGKKINKRAFDPISDSYSPELRELVDQMIQVDPQIRPDINAVYAIAQQQVGAFRTPTSEQ